MKIKIKKLWIKALLSGEYKQARGTLHRAKSGNKCCLGVLCFLAEQAGIIKKHKFRESRAGPFIYKYGTDWSYLPSIVAKWAGLKDHNPSVEDKVFGRTSLAVLNDSGKSFKDIAGVIERNL